jgi:hypothetical protein
MASPSLLCAQGSCLKGSCTAGYGEYRFENGDLYKGQFKNGRFEGQGILYFKNGDKYLGNWVASQRQGRGRLEFADKSVYVGAFVNDKMDGEGERTYPDGSRYTGAWRNNQREGEGKLQLANGEILQGIWKSDQYQASWGSILYPGDTINLRNCNTDYCSGGIGKFTYSNGNRFVGDFRDGRPEGTGILYYKGGDRYEGDWRRDAPNGKGVMHYRDGRVLGAVWDGGKPIQQLFAEDGSGSNEKGSTTITDFNKQVKIWAVVIGAARYTAMPLLRYTDDDAYQIFAFLKSPEGGALPDNQLRLLIDEDATRSNILYAMRSVFAKADENDVVLLYFSGHGIEGAFLPIDYDGVKNKLLHTEVRDLLVSSKAKHKIVLADACHSGGLYVVKNGVDTDLAKFYKAFETSRGGMALLMSSKGEEFSLEDSGLRSGVFSHFVIRGLKGEADSNNNKIVSVQELYNFVYKQVRKYTANIQTPMLTGTFDPNMPIAVVR